MKLDAFDRHVLAQRGNAREIIKKLYGISISDTGARKGLSMVRKHLRFKQMLLDLTKCAIVEKRTPSWFVITRFSVDVNKLFGVRLHAFEQNADLLRTKRF